MDGSDSGAGQHGDRKFRRHRHVNADHVTSTNAQRLERRCALTNLGEQFTISERPRISRFAFPKDRDGVALPRRDVGIQAIVARIGLPSDEPLHVGSFPVANRLEGLEPMQVFQRFAAPKRIGMVFRLGIQRFVLLLRRDHRLSREFGRR